MKLYRLSDDVSENGYAYFSLYGSIDDMRFLPPKLLELNNKSWEIDPMKPGMEIAPGRKRAWPDFIHNGSGYPGFFVSDKVIWTLKSVEIEFYRLTEMPIGAIQGKWHQTNPPPKYYVAEIEFGGIMQDYKLSGYDELDLHGGPTRDARLRRPAFTNDVYILNTWNGKDIFSYTPSGAVVDASTSLFCTEKVKFLAERNGWTNVKFQELDVV